MKRLVVFILSAMPLYADTFTIERNDPRQFRIHRGPDETAATKAMIDELASEVKRVTGVSMEIKGYDTAKSGNIFVATQPWDANGAWTIGVRNGIVGIHGSDVKGTEAALRFFIDKYLKPVPESAGRLEWKDLRVNHGPQWADVREATIAKVREQRRRERALEWQNELVNYVNVEPARAYSFPLASEKDALTPDLPETPYVKSLDGKWKYNWGGSYEQRARNQFYSVGYDDSRWYEIDVPSCVEMRGFGSPGYVNVRYPHKLEWPFIKDRQSGKADYNPVSSYRRTFTVPPEWKDREVFLRFDGVYSAYYVWVNGMKVGYAEDSCTAHEFNVTKYLKPGENLLAVEVYRWSDGAFLEDQDFFRYSGIYRHVMLFSPPQVEIRDFFWNPTLAADFKSATVDLSVELRDLDDRKATALPSVSATLYDADFKAVATGKGKSATSNSQLSTSTFPLPVSGPPRIHTSTRSS